MPLITPISVIISPIFAAPPDCRPGHYTSTMPLNAKNNNQALWKSQKSTRDQASLVLAAGHKSFL